MLRSLGVFDNEPQIEGKAIVPLAIQSTPCKSLSLWNIVSFLGESYFITKGHEVQESSHFQQLSTYIFNLALLSYHYCHLFDG